MAGRGTGLTDETITGVDDTMIGLFFSVSKLRGLPVVGSTIAIPLLTFSGFLKRIGLGVVKVVDTGGLMGVLGGMPNPEGGL